MTTSIGVMWVNDVQIVGWEKLGRNGIILALSDYLFKEHIENSSSDNQLSFPREYLDDTQNEIDEKKQEEPPPQKQKKKMKKKPGSDTESYLLEGDVIRKEKCHVLEYGEGDEIFKSVTVCEEELIDPESVEGKRIKRINDARKEESSESRQNDAQETVLPDFLQDIVDVLSVLRFGNNQFLDYIQNVDIGESSFVSGEKFTALIPFDEAFRKWQPIDYGFNPFSVEGFAKQVVLNHIVIGEIDKGQVEEGATFKTLAGNDVTFSRQNDKRKLTANGVELSEGGTPVPNGQLLFVDKLLFVTHKSVQKLNSQFEYLETGPLLPVPWYKSQFLSHVYKILTEREGFEYVSGYMNQTAELGSYAEDFGK